MGTEKSKPLTSAALRAATSYLRVIEMLHLVEHEIALSQSSLGKRTAELELARDAIEVMDRIHHRQLVTVASAYSIEVRASIPSQAASRSAFT